MCKKMYIPSAPCCNLNTIQQFQWIFMVHRFISFLFRWNWKTLTKGMIALKNDLISIVVLISNIIRFKTNCWYLLSFLIFFLGFPLIFKGTSARLLTIGWSLFLISVVVGYIVGAVSVYHFGHTNNNPIREQKYSSLSDMLRNKKFQFIGVENGSTHQMLKVCNFV
jgi:hypothetical protein